MGQSLTFKIERVLSILHPDRELVPAGTHGNECSDWESFKCSPMLSGHVGNIDLSDDSV